MILVDANLLIYAVDSTSPRHAASRDWLDSRLNGSARVGLPWQSLLAFTRIISNPRIFSRPLSIDYAWNQVEEWLSLPPVWIPHPTERHGEVLASLLRDHVDRSKLVADAHLAAIAMEHGLILCSADSDFARFSEVRWENPLTQKGRRLH